MSCYHTNSNFCHNPCLITSTNTAECESLPSQIQNFTDAFFGTVVKTEEDGNVVWNLPCDLDIGLPNNPRAAGEGLACYFLRLFGEGIVGLTGPAGDEGSPGADGRNAYTVLLTGFNQPTLAAPNVTLITNYNPAILTGMYVFVALSGWYLITNADVSGALSATLVKSSGGTADGAWVSAGKLVVPSGYPGATITGPTGPTGALGPMGSPGVSWTTTRGQWTNDGAPGSDYSLTGSYAVVDFVGGSAAEVAVQLPAHGVYLISCGVVLNKADGTPLVNLVELELRDETHASSLAGSYRAITINRGVAGNAVDVGGYSVPVTITVLFACSEPTYVKLRAKAGTASDVVIANDQVCINYVRLSDALAI